VRDPFLAAADVALTLIREPAVARRWTEPSALTGMTVGGLAAHLGAQVQNVWSALSADAFLADGVRTLPEHYDAVRWRGAPLDDEANRWIVVSTERAAGDGPEAVLDRVTRACETLPARLAAVPGDQPVLLPWTGWALTLDDLLVTRMMEIAVHGDDLAVSVDLPTPVLPDEVFAPVAALLTDLAARRHGQAAVLRALARRERAPETIAAL
jgi:hypothetical protein